MRFRLLYQEDREVGVLRRLKFDDNGGKEEEVCVTEAGVREFRGSSPTSPILTRRARASWRRLGSENPNVDVCGIEPRLRPDNWAATSSLARTTNGSVLRLSCAAAAEASNVSSSSWPQAPS